MHHYLKTSAIGLGVAVCSLLLAGCAGGTANRTPVDYDHLPGSGDRMADGPGIMSPQKGADYDSGVRLYSDEPSKRALINRDRQSGTITRSSSSSQQPAAPAAEPTPAQRRDFEEFQEYQEFRNMPKDSAEYQRFQDWQEWKQYQQWRQGQSQ